MRIRVATAVCLGLLAAALPASAQFTTISQPTSAYTSATTLLAITADNGTTVNSITAGSQTVTFSSPLKAAQVGVSGWSTWGAPPNTESATPKVLTNIVEGATTLTLTLSSGVTTFGLEIEPNTFGSYDITATFYNGSTVLGTVTRNINGSAGALLAAASSSGTPITRVVISSVAGANGFAIAQLRYGATPVPALGPIATVVLGMLLLVALVVMTRRQRGVTAAR
jgi:hypothetical protein